MLATAKPDPRTDDEKILRQQKWFRLLLSMHCTDHLTTTGYIEEGGDNKKLLAMTNSTKTSQVSASITHVMFAQNDFT